MRRRGNPFRPSFEIYDGRSAVWTGGGPRRDCLFTVVHVLHNVCAHVANELRVSMILSFNIFVCLFYTCIEIYSMEILVINEL